MPFYDDHQQAADGNGVGRHVVPRQSPHIVNVEPVDDYMRIPVDMPIQAVAVVSGTRWRWRSWEPVEARLRAFCDRHGLRLEVERGQGRFRHWWSAQVAGPAIPMLMAGLALARWERVGFKGEIVE